MNVIDKGREAVVSISRTVAELVATRPEGYFARELLVFSMLIRLSHTDTKSRRFR